MADGSDTLTASAAPDSLVAGLKAFASEHGGGKAVIEYVGRKGARIVLVGRDGSWGDEFTSSTDIARAACAEAGLEVERGWERELIDHMRPSNDLWRSMGRRSLAR
jgi:hypothetical protein